MAPPEHEWTQFEMHTLLCLMARGVHLPPVKMKRGADEGEARQHAHVDVATGLNTALNGKSNYGNDIPKRDVSKMIDRILSERKGIMGPGGYMERSKLPRVTRGLRMAFERHNKLDYDGSLTEWELWRQMAEAEKTRLANDGLPLAELDPEVADQATSEVGEAQGSIENDQYGYSDGEEEGSIEESRYGNAHPEQRSKDREPAIWEQADLAVSSSRARWAGTSPSYAPQSRLHAATEPYDPDDNFATFHSRYSPRRHVAQYKQHPNLPNKPRFSSSATPSLTYNSSPPEKASSMMMHSLPKKPVSILKESSGRAQDRFSGNGFDAERYTRFATNEENVEGEKRKKPSFGSVEWEKLSFDRLARGAGEKASLPEDN